MIFVLVGKKRVRRHLGRYGRTVDMSPCSVQSRVFHAVSYIDLIKCARNRRLLC